MSRNALNATCYYCGAAATSAEHVPPRCIFPERKDAFGVDHRKNLITVPSCDEHNLEKSTDDEFLMACVSPVVGNNASGRLQTGTKLFRALKRSNGRLLKAVLRDAKQIHLEWSHGTRFPVWVGKADTGRLLHILDHVARGLFFHVTGQRFIGQCHIIPDFVQAPYDPTYEFFRRLISAMISEARSQWVKQGDNPDIFYFQVGPKDQFGLIPMVLTFFHGAHVLVSFQPDGVSLPHRGLPSS